MVATNSLFQDSGIKIETVSIPKTNLAFISRDIWYNKAPDGYDVLSTPKYAIINVGANEGLLSAAAESLHFVFTQYYNSHVNRSVACVTDESQVEEIIAGWKERDEAIVHGVALAWMDDRRERFGLSSVHLAGRETQFNNDPMYRFTGLVKRKIRERGLHNVIELYVKTPEELFR
jgi:hypothetical protein